MQIRPYRTSDAAATLDVVLSAITQTASHDYSPEQIRAWADADARSIEAWAAELVAGTIVAELDGSVAGFSDVDASGYIDRLFVHPQHARQGVASALLHALVPLARAAGAHELWTNASITARPVFERNGFIVVREQWPVVRGVGMRNYRMRRLLSPE